MDIVASGVQNGLYFGNAVGGQGADHSNGVVNNLGTISSDSRALNIDGLGLTVNNDGLILGTGNQRNGTIYADSTAQDFTLNNDGVVDAGEGLEGAAFSVELSESGNNFIINNSGQLLGRGNAGAGLATAGDGIRLERSRVDGALDGTTTGLFTGVITNTGEVSSEGANGTVGGFRAVNGVSFQGVLNNAGTISGVQNGVYFGNPTPAGGGDHTGGVVNNFGVFSSDSRAFNLDGDGLTVNNAGDILATGRQRNGTFYADGTADNFSLNNLASGTIDARGGAGSGVSIQVGSSADDVQNGSIVNAGLIAGSGDQPVDAGIRLFTNNPGATFVGDIVNQVGGTITADTAPAILVQQGVNFDGTLVNAGLIDGGISLSSGAIDLDSTSVLSLDIASLTEFETVDVLGPLDLDGILELTFTNIASLQVGQTFDILDFDSITGDFQSINSGQVLLDTSDLQIGGSVSIVAVPEPASLILLGLGGLTMGFRRRPH
ncbi:MAG: PEP-CTERM sorting domain-containing protein [Planctomycetota bacterium]